MNQPITTDLGEGRQRLDEAASMFAAQPQNALAVQERDLMASNPFQDNIVVAQNVPVRRNIGEFLNRMKILAQMAGEDYRYQYPVKDKGGRTKTIEGGSIKMANDLAREYGNNTVDCRVVENGNDWVFYARFTDLETGFSLTRPFRQRRTQKTVNTDADRALDIVFQIGASKAIRNVVLNALQTYADAVYEESKASLVEKIGKRLDHYREKIKAVCTERGFDLTRVEKQVAKPIAEWLAVDVTRVIAELKSISDGMATFDDLYPLPEGAVAETPTEQKSNLEKFKEDNIPETFPAQQHPSPAERVEATGAADLKKAEDAAKKFACASCEDTGMMDSADLETGNISKVPCLCKKEPGKLI